MYRELVADEGDDINVATVVLQKRANFFVEQIIDAVEAFEIGLAQIFNRVGGRSGNIGRTFVGSRRRAQGFGNFPLEFLPVGGTVLRHRQPMINIEDVGHVLDLK